MVQALHPLGTEGMCRVNKPRVRGEEPTSTPDYEILVPVYLLSLLVEVPEALGVECAKVNTIEGERVHISELIDRTDDQDAINYTREESPWDQQKRRRRLYITLRYENYQ